MENTLLTLTTDFGLTDHYTAALKGAMLKQVRALTMVDISHLVNTHDIVQAAFTLRNAWHHFPEGTIHIVSVHNAANGNERFLVFEHQSHFFIGPDNGIFSLALDQTPQNVRFLTFGRLNFTNIQTQIAHAVGHLAKGFPLAELGEALDHINQRIHLQPVITKSQIRGAVVHIDSYKNVVSNISQSLFQQVGQGRDFQLYYRRHDPISRISTAYNEVQMGETLCLFNSGFLEIAIHLGKASELLGLNIDDSIQIDFLE